MFIAHGLVSTKKQTNTSIRQISCFLVNQDQICNLTIDYAINSIDDSRVVLRDCQFGTIDLESRS